MYEVFMQGKNAQGHRWCVSVKLQFVLSNQQRIKESAAATNIAVITNDLGL